MNKLFAPLAMTAIVLSAFASADASARIFDRKHGYYSFTPSKPTTLAPSVPVLTGDDFTYPDKGDGKVRVLQTIGEHRYFVLYRVGDDGVPVAEVTHIFRDGKYAALTPESEIPQTSKVIQTIPGVGTFAFLFKGHRGEVYAERLEAQDLQPFWKILPALNGKYRLMREMERAAALSSERAKILESHLDAQRNSPELQRVLRSSQGSTAYQRFFTALKPLLPTQLPSREEVVQRAGFEITSRGTHTLIAPLDPKRPGVIITSDELHFEEVDAVVAELRNATTATIVERGSTHNPETLKRLRANSTIIAQPGKKLEEGMKHARDEIASLPAYVAAGCVVEAQKRTGPGTLASAATRVERAASGGPGKRRFEEGLTEAKHEAVAAAKASLDEMGKLIVEKTREMAYQQAARIQQHADGFGKKSDYVGFEIDFFNTRPRGVEFAVQTQDGKTYRLQNVGRNFSDGLGDFLPAKTYAQFNVALLRIYEKNGSIAKGELYETAMQFHLYPTAEGEIVFINPVRYPKERMRVIRQGLREKFEQNKSLVFKDIRDI